MSSSVNLSTFNPTNVSPENVNIACLEFSMFCSFEKFLILSKFNLLKFSLIFIKDFTSEKESLFKLPDKLSVL